MKKLFRCRLLPMMLCSAAVAQDYRITRSIPLGGSGARDYLRADAEARRLYVSHSNEVVVLGLDTQKELARRDARNGYCKAYCSRKVLWTSTGHTRGHRY
jgi:hypothetical protein